MNFHHSSRITIFFVALIALLAVACSREEPATTKVLEDSPTNSQPTYVPPPTSTSSIQSPYVGQETRKIKFLSPQDIEGLLHGAGTPFGGLAKPAELNGYPGPRHVLDAVESGEFHTTGEQLEQVEHLYEGMRTEAIGIGELIVELEESIDNAFSSGIVTEESLRDMALESGDLYGRLRVIHLSTHLSMIDVLTPSQVVQYNSLRGYASGDDPCAKVPAGHDPELWKMHNNCQ